MTRIEVEERTVYRIEMSREEAENLTELLELHVGATTIGSMGLDSLLHDLIAAFPNREQNFERSDQFGLTVVYRR